MQVKSVTYGRTINVGNYESVRIDITVEATDESETATSSVVAQKLFDRAMSLITAEEVNIRREYKLKTP